MSKAGLNLHRVSYMGFIAVVPLEIFPLHFPQKREYTTFTVAKYVREQFLESLCKTEREVHILNLYTNFT